MSLTRQAIAMTESFVKAIPAFIQQECWGTHDGRRKSRALEQPVKGDYFGWFIGLRNKPATISYECKRSSSR